MTTVRLSPEIEQKLEVLSRTRYKTKSDIIKEALELLFRSDESEQNSYEIGQAVFGIYGSGDGNRSTTYRTRLKDRIISIDSDFDIYRLPGKANIENVFPRAR
ncbi:MAG: CopG family transcriptional regulator [Spirochaeta sp.]|jgi:Arc/MetJ-type ribon-helix-helix transcriptional regulator|nr:CopG family transcriptional regulator [Spirochaeta sp.]